MKVHSTLKPMTRYVFVFLSLASSVAAREKPDRWMEVKSPHFIVATNGSEKQARRAADQFERIRAVFQKVFPGTRVDPAVPIVVLAMKDEKTFDALTPVEWQRKGQLKRSGLFLTGPDKNYVLLLLDAEGENPYHILYHEYTHLLIHEGITATPLWLDEGLAEFYGNSEIQGKDILLGKPSQYHIQLLRDKKLLPLPTLFAVDHQSPYYNEENKGNVFYAESWALTHYLIFQARKGDKDPLRDYTKLLAQDVDPVTAAARAFGDLKALQNTLEDYVRQSAFKELLMKGSTEVDEDQFKVKELSSANEKALRGDFLAYNGQFSPARDLLSEALQEDPNDAQAAESMGFLEFRQGHSVEARKWFEQAVKLNSQSYLAHYYYAVMNMQAANSLDAAQVESSLQTAIKVNPDFAPAYDALAGFYAMRGEKLDEARMLSLHAVTLEPGNIRYRINGGSILLRMNRVDDAVHVATLTLSMANTTQDKAAAQAFLESARQYQEYLASAARNNQELKTSADATGKVAENQNTVAGQRSSDDEGANPPVLRHRDESRDETATAEDRASPPPLRHRPEDARGPSDMLEGKIASVKCSSPAVMDLTFDTGGRTVALHSSNYFKVEYSALNFKPSAELEPCSQIQGMKARIAYYQINGQPYTGEIIAVQLRK